MPLNTFLHFRKIFIIFLLSIVVVAIGITGFMVIESYTFNEAFYMTIITIATVGFEEVHPLSENGRLFTSFLIIFSFSTFAYTISAITKYVVEGEFNEYFKLRKINSAIEKLNGHTVICGYGRNGRQAAAHLKSYQLPFVVIEKNHELIRLVNHHGFLCIEGDCTQDEILFKSGIEKATSLITTLPIDADNLFVVLTARTANKKLRIISRASDDNSDKKLKAAGADNVIMPDKIGGAHMASLVVNPDVIEFLDYISGQGGIDIKLEEVELSALSAENRQKTIRTLDIRNRSGATVVGLRKSNGEYIVNPSLDTSLSIEGKIFVLGTRKQISDMKKMIFSEN